MSCDCTHSLPTRKMAQTQASDTLFTLHNHIYVKSTYKFKHRQNILIAIKPGNRLITSRYEDALLIEKGHNGCWECSTSWFGWYWWVYISSLTECMAHPIIKDNRIKKVNVGEKSNSFKWFSTLLMLWLFNTGCHAVMTPNQKTIFSATSELECFYCMDHNVIFLEIEVCQRGFGPTVWEPLL